MADIEATDDWIRKFGKLLPPYILGFITIEYAFFEFLTEELYKVITTLGLIFFSLLAIYVFEIHKEKRTNFLELGLIAINSTIYIIVVANQSFNFITGDLAVIIYMAVAGWTFFLPRLYNAK